MITTVIDGDNVQTYVDGDEAGNDVDDQLEEEDDDVDGSASRGSSRRSEARIQSRGSLHGINENEHHANHHADPIEPRSRGASRNTASRPSTTADDAAPHNFGYSDTPGEPLEENREIESAGSNRSRNISSSRNSATRIDTNKIHSISGIDGGMDSSRKDSSRIDSSRMDSSRVDSRMDSRTDSRASSRAESRSESRKDARSEIKSEINTGSRANSRAENSEDSRKDSRVESRNSDRINTQERVTSETQYEDEETRTGDEEVGEGEYAEEGIERKFDYLNVEDEQEKEAEEIEKEIDEESKLIEEAEPTSLIHNGIVIERDANKKVITKLFLQAN